MSAPIIQGFYTTADLDGIKKMSGGLKQVRGDMAGLDVQAAKTSSTFDSTLKKIERPLGREVFRSIALQATGAAQGINSIQSAGAAAALGLETVGRVALGFTGTLGLVVLGVVALASILYKLKGSAEGAAEKIKEQSDKLLAQSEAAKKAAESLYKLGVINEADRNRLRDISALREKDLEDLRKKITTEQALQKITVERLDQKIKENRIDTNLLLATDLKIQANQKIAALDLQLIALGGAATTQEEKRSEAMRRRAEMEIQLSAIQAEATINAWGAAGKYNEILIEQIRLKEQLALAEQTLADALRRGDDIAAESAKKRIDSLQSLASASNSAMSKMQTQIRTIADEIVKVANISANAWEYQNDRLVWSSEKAGAELIKLTGDYLTKIIAMEAAVAFAQGNIAKGIALGVAAGVVSTIAGAASAYLAHEGSRGTANSPAGAGSMSSPSESGGNMTNLIVRIEGGQLDDRAIDNLAKMLSKRVQTGNVRLVSSTVQPAYGVLP